ncbi:MAG: ABC transporter permease [Anaerolineae bacterium]
MRRRLWALVQKEFIQLIRDRRTFIAVLIGPSIELLLFAAAVHTDVRHIPMVVADQSASASSRSYLNAFLTSDSFEIVYRVSGEAEVMQAIDSGEASIGVVIPPDFADHVQRGDATALIVVDGSTSFTSQSALNSATAISQEYAENLRSGQSSPLIPHIQILYNPDLRDTWFIAPAFIALLLYALALNLTSLAIVRERERGTIEALLVTPVRPFELMLAKTIPSLVVALTSATGLLAVSTLVLGVPFRGSLLVFVPLALIGVGCGLGVGLLVSSAVQTQNQSQQLVSLLNITMIFVGGVFFPVYTLPLALRIMSYIIPMTYFIPILRGMSLKGIGLAELWPQVLALAALFAASLVVASRLFRQRLE